MFAKLAHYCHFGRTHDAGFATRPCNDNRLLSLVGASRRPRRGPLACHWHKTPSGALECFWTTEDDDTGGAAAQEPQIYRLDGSPRLAA